MSARLRVLWEKVCSGLWFVPCVFMAFGIGLASVVRSLDGADVAGGLTIEWFDRMDIGQATSLVSTVATSVLGAMSVVFSATIVVLTLASSQLGPRLVRGFTQDRVTQVTLGSFLGTFLFALIVLASLPAEPANESGFGWSLTTVLAWTLADIVLLAFFLHKLSVSIQISSVVSRVQSDLNESIERVLEDRGGEGEAPESEVDLGEHRDSTVRTEHSGYIQVIDVPQLVELARRLKVSIRLHVRPGHFLSPGFPVATVAGDGSGRFDREAPDELVQAIEDSLSVGFERTLAEDCEFAIVQLVDVALRALSPGVNDPITAVVCVDYLSSALSRISGRDFRAPVARDQDGVPRVRFPGTSFEGLMDAAFHPLRQASSANVSLTIRLLEALERIACNVTDRTRQATIATHAELIWAQARTGIESEHDLADVRARYELVVDPAAC